MNDVPTSESSTERPTTTPVGFPISVRGFESEAEAAEFAQLLGEYVIEISRNIDLSQLDGVTVAYDYSQALANLDRGYQSAQTLTPSEGAVVGVAMTPSVIRGEQLKSHIVFNALYVRPLENTEHEYYRSALHTLAHECAHVEVTHSFDMAFPNRLLKRGHADMQDALRWQVILACWDEYAATSITAQYGEAPTVGYEDTLLGALAEIRNQVNELIIAYRVHADVQRILEEVYSAMGNLLKFSAYHLGNLAGLGMAWTEMPRTVTALEGHWFRSYFFRLEQACREVAGEYSAWKDDSAFRIIGDLVDELVALAGLHITKTLNGGLHVNIPFTAETMPK
jgi:hypothetical protein